MSFLKKNGKLILGVLFILLALTPILLIPLNKLFWCAIYGGIPPKAEILSWFNFNWSTYLLSGIYFVLGVNFIIQRAVPNVKLPQWIYAIVFVLLTYFAVSSVITSFRYFNYYFGKNLELYWTEIIDGLFGIGTSVLKLIACIMVVVGLLVKGKGKALAVIPSILFIIGGVTTIIGSLVEFAYIVYLSIRTGWWETIMIFLGYNNLPEILYNLVYIFAMVLFCYLFIMRSDENAKDMNKKDTKDTPCAKETSAENSADELLVGLEADVKAEAAQSAKETGNAPKLTPLQVEQLQKLKEAYDVGVISELEFAAKRSKILGDND